jgi:D-xylose transport system substrate-binding protein
MNLRTFLVLLSCALSILTGIVLSRSQRTASTSTPTRQRPLIGLSLDTLKEERWIGDRDLFVAAAKQLGADVTVVTANSLDTQQITDIQGLITQQVDAIVIVPHDGAAMAKAVDLAHAAGIPVLAYDRLITGTDLDLYITFDNVKVGELQAQFLADRIPPAGKLRIVRIYGSQTDNNARLFKQGQDNILQPLISAGKVEVLFEDWAADWKPENAKKIMQAAVTQKGTGIDAVLASNDGTAGGAIQSLTEDGLAGKVLVTGQDADLAACQRIAAGTQTMTVYKPLKNLAPKAAELAVKLAQRKPVVAKSEIPNGKLQVPSVLLDIIAVTQHNLRQTVIADGFRQQADVYAK